MRVLKWIIVSSLMGVLAACASSQAVTPPPIPTDLPTVVPTATPLIAATAPVEQAATAQPPTDSPPATPALKSTFIFLWEPG